MGQRNSCMRDFRGKKLMLMHETIIETAWTFRYLLNKSSTCRHSFSLPETSFFSGSLLERNLFVFLVYFLSLSVSSFPFQLPVSALQCPIHCLSDNRNLNNTMWSPPGSAAYITAAQAAIQLSIAARDLASQGILVLTMHFYILCLDLSVLLSDAMCHFRPHLSLYKPRKQNQTSTFWMIQEHKPPLSHTA